MKASSFLDRFIQNREITMMSLSELVSLTACLLAGCAGLGCSGIGGIAGWWGRRDEAACGYATDVADVENLFLEIERGGKAVGYLKKNAQMYSKPSLKPVI